MAVKASATITLNSVVDIKATYRYYLLQSSIASKPAKPTTNPPGGSWTDAEPTYTSGSTNSLYFVDLTVFSDDKFSYSAVSKSTSYEAAKEAYNKAQNAQNSIDNLEIGGRNLFSGYGEEEIQLDKYNNVGSFTQFSNHLTFNPCETVGETYTISFWAKSPNGSTPLRMYNSNGNPRHFNFSTHLTESLGTEWTHFKVTITNLDAGESYSDSFCNRIEIYAPNQMGVLVKKIKVEKGNKATDWSPAPEDVSDDINKAQNVADEAAKDVTRALSEIQILADGIASFVRGDGGGSLMKQDANGVYYFDISGFEKLLSDTANGLDALNGLVLDANGKIDVLQSTAEALQKRTEYIRSYTDENDNPCLELGEGDSAYKAYITNNGIQLMDGTSTPTSVTRQMLVIEKAMVRKELQIGDEEDTSATGVWIWKRRTNGNLGLSWKEIVPKKVETCTITLGVDYAGDIVVDYVNNGSNKTVTAPASDDPNHASKAETTIEADCGSEITLTHTEGENLSFYYGGFTVISDDGDVLTLRVPSESGTYYWSFDHS